MIIRRLASTIAAHPAAFQLPPTIKQILASTPTTHKTSASTVSVSGWIKSVRKQKNVTFAMVSDGSAAPSLQAVIVRRKENDEDGLLRSLTNGSAVRITGQLLASPAKGQKLELLVDERVGGRWEVLGECDPETYPIQKQSLSAEHLRDNVHLRARTAQIASMLRIRDRLTRKINNWFEEQGFCSVNTPILTSGDAEGAGESFRISRVSGEHPAELPSSKPAPLAHFFSKPAYLTVSHQLHLEALASSLSRVYTLSPCFRAEKSVTGRHLAEFWMLEAEWAFGNNVHPVGGTQTALSQPRDVEQVCALVEGCLRSVAGELALSTTDDDMLSLWSTADPAKRQALYDAFHTPNAWRRMSYTEAIKELVDFNTWSPQKFVFTPAWGNPLQSEHERWLAEVLFGAPVFVTDYPADLKPFYARENGEGAGDGTVACVDLLVPHVGELVGGSVREDRLHILKAKLEKTGIERDGYRWYEELRQFGGAPHAGFGMGLERLVGWIGGIENVRECVPMPRWVGRMLL